MRNGPDPGGRPSCRLEELVLGEILASRAESHRSETFLQFRNEEFTFAEVDELSNRTAQGLQAAGVRDESRDDRLKLRGIGRLGRTIASRGWNTSWKLQGDGKCHFGGSDTRRDGDDCRELDVPRCEL